MADEIRLKWREGAVHGLSVPQGSPVRPQPPRVNRSKRRVTDPRFSAAQGVDQRSFAGVLHSLPSNSAAAAKRLTKRRTGTAIFPGKQVNG